MTVMDWILLGLNTITFALGHYHGKTKALAPIVGTVNTVLQNLTDSQAAEAARAGTAAGAAANEASHLAGHEGKK